MAFPRLTPLTLRPRPAHRWLWMLAFSVGVFIATVTLANVFQPADRSITRGMFGHDFLAFYSAGLVAGERDVADLHDLAALSQVQHEIASRDGIEMPAAVAPWWNPPHVALLFAPLASLSFHSALATWTLVNVLCLIAAAAVLVTIVRGESRLPQHWLLVPALLLVAPPTIQALGHGQNTMVSLLLLTLTTLAWRNREPMWAGIACSLLFYKPQLAAVVMLALVVTLGWRVLIGLLIGGLPQALATVIALPGAITAYVERLPANLQQIQFEQPYLWHRHATISGFFRFVFQGNAPGQTSLWISIVSGLCVLVVAAALALAWWRLRPDINGDDCDEIESDAAMDRLIALVVLATPLLVPFFFDYDLLLLAVPAVLVGRDMLAMPDASTAARWTRRVAALLFVWLMCNAPLAESTGVHLTVPLLCLCFGLHAWRCTFPHEVVVTATRVAPNVMRTSSRLAA